MAVSRSTPPSIATVFETMRKSLSGTHEATINQIAEETQDPFRVLISTMISLRTKDEVTSSAAKRLFAIADTPRTMAAMSEKEIAECIYPAGFYRTKATHIRSCARILLERYAGRVPADRKALTELPGVGVKTANLTLNLGFGIEAICVDTHVHRISNRLGWIRTTTPEKSEEALEAFLPRTYWIEINGLFVRYGQTVCTPVSPRCSECGLDGCCMKVGVTRSR